MKAQDRGPVIFRQTRVGRGGELFTLLKFRSMVIDAENRKANLLALSDGHGALFKLQNDPRITPFGRFLRTFLSMSCRSCSTCCAGPCRLSGRALERSRTRPLASRALAPAVAGSTVVMEGVRLPVRRVAGAYLDLYYPALCFGLLVVSEDDRRGESLSRILSTSVRKPLGASAPRAFPRQ